MTPRSSPLSWAALAIGLFVVGGAALDAGAPGSAATEPDAATFDAASPDAGAQDPGAEGPEVRRSAAQDPAELAPGALAVRYGGDVAVARRTLGTSASAADFRRMRTLGVDAVVIDCRIDAGSPGKDRGVTLEGDARVQAAADQARSEGLAVVLWPVVVASPSGPRLDDLPGLLGEARLRRERRLRVLAARRFGSERMIALDGSIGSVEEVKGHPLEVSRDRLRAWREDLGGALDPLPGGAAVEEPDRFAVLLGADALANAVAGRSGIPDDWGLGVWIGGAAQVEREAVAATVARHALVGGARLELLSTMYDGGDAEPLLDLARARDEHAEGAAIVIGTWRYGGGGALAGLAPEVWEALAR